MINKSTIILIVFIISSMQLASQKDIIRMEEQNKMNIPSYCLFFDNNTLKGIQDVGENFDIDSFIESVTRCGVDYMVFTARCDQGFAYYNTKIGTKHPTLKYDLFGEISKACKERNIALGAYFNAGISSSEGLAHREWTTLYFDGRTLQEDRLSPFVRTMCYNTAYREHLISMIKEVVNNYQISSLMIDCLISNPCICPVCIQEMKEKGIDWLDENEVKNFAEFSAVRLAEDIAKEAKKINPHLMISNNYPSYEKLKNINSYFDVVSLPTSDIIGYDYLPIMAHYVRTLDLPVINMIGRFYEWGDFGGLLPEEAIKANLLYGLANGMIPNIGGHFHPRGDLQKAVFDRIESVYNYIRKFENYYVNAKNITDVAIVYPKSIENLRGDLELRSATRMLDELKCQFDVVTLSSDWSKYKVLIFPDDIIFTDEISKRVREHINSGKAIISSGFSGLNSDTTEFELEKEWGVKYIQKNDFNPAYFEVKNEYSHNLPDMAISYYSPGIEMLPISGTIIGANLVKPYQNKSWDGEYAICYNPPEKITEIPALTINGKVAHFSNKIFFGYFEKGSVELRTILSNVLNELLPEPILKFENLPSFARAYVTDIPGKRVIHLLSYLPEMRGKVPIIEEGIQLNDIKVSIRVDDKKIKRVYQFDGNKKKMLKGNMKKNYLEVDISQMKGYCVIVFEE